MTEVEWLHSTDPTRMLRFLGVEGQKRKMQLFACGCVRRVWHLLSWNDAARQCILLAEGLADGEEVGAELAASRESAARTNAGARGFSADGSAAALWATRLDWFQPWDVAEMAARAQGSPDEPAQQAKLLRCLFGNPFHPCNIVPTWLTWNDGAVRNIAGAIYDERAFDRMPILADALEDAGCDNADILRHCREPGEHVRGCWVIDLLLGKK